MQLIQPEATEVQADAEWAVRVELAALYRLAALQGWDDLIFTHISARVPGPEHHFLINPLGLMFEEITASCLVKVDLDGNIIGDSGGAAINRAGFVIHGAIHAARADASFVIHLHTLDGMAVSAQKEGLLPLQQSSLGVLPRLTYHDYEGVAFDLEEQERLVRDLGDKALMLLRNHGTLSVGKTAGEAWLLMYALERACSLQVRALTAGREGILLAPENAIRKVERQVAESGAGRQTLLAWNALLRQLQRRSPGFDA